MSRQRNLDEKKFEVPFTDMGKVEMFFNSLSVLLKDVLQFGEDIDKKKNERKLIQREFPDYTYINRSRKEILNSYEGLLNKMIECYTPIFQSHKLLKGTDYNEIPYELDQICKKIEDMKVIKLKKFKKELDLLEDDVRAIVQFYSHIGVRKETLGLTIEDGKKSFLTVLGYSYIPKD